MMFVRKAQRIRRELQVFKDELEELDTSDEINLGQRAVSKDFGFIKNILLRQEFYLDDERVEFDSDCKITQVDKTTTGKAEWREEQLRGAHWSAKLGAPAFRSINGTATFYTTNKLRHETQIALLKRTIQSKEQDLADDEEMLQTLSASTGRQPDASVEDLAAKIEASTALLTKVQQRDLDLSLWPKLKQFYADKTTLNNSMNFREFVRVYDAALAEAM